MRSRLFSRFLPLLVLPAFAAVAPVHGQEPRSSTDPVAAIPAGEVRRTREDLLRLAASGDRPVRLHAIDKLGRTRDPALTAQVIPLGRDRDPEIRAAVCSALGDLGGTAALDAILGAIGDEDPRVAASAARACERIDAPEAVERLLRTAPLGTPALRRAVHLALVRLTGWDHGAIESDDPSEAAQAWEEWRRWGEANVRRSRRAWFMDGLGSPAAAQRCRSLARLGDLGDISALPACIEALGDVAAPVAEAAMRTAERLSGLKLPESDLESESGRLAAREAWRRWRDRTGDRGRGEWLLAGLKAELPVTRASAARALGAFRITPGEPVGGNDILDMPEEAEARIPALIEALADRAPPVAEAAAGSLKALSGRTEEFDPEASLETRRLASARWELWWKANRRRDRRAWLEDSLLNDPVPANRVEAARRLASDDRPATFDLLLQALSDPAASVRAAALSALRLGTGESFGFDPELPADTQSGPIARWEEWISARRRRR